MIFNNAQDSRPHCKYTPSEVVEAKFGSSVNFGSHSIINPILNYNSYVTTVTAMNATHIGDYAFQGCQYLENVEVPNIDSVGAYAFDGCSNLEFGNLEPVLALASYIGPYAFRSCTKLTDMTLVSLGSLSIATGTFAGCTSLGYIHGIDEIHTIGTYAFQSCTALSYLGLHQCNVVESYAFAGCTSLSQLGDTNSITQIMDHAFLSCTVLHSMQLVSITNIGDNAFQDCSEFWYLDLRWVPSVPTLGTSVFVGTAMCTFTSVYSGWIRVPESLYSQFRTATNWNVYASRILSQDG